MSTTWTLSGCEIVGVVRGCVSVVTSCGVAVYGCSAAEIHCIAVVSAAALASDFVVTSGYV